MQAPAAPAPKQWGPVILGLTGGLVALIGAVIPWTILQTCTNTAFMNVCVPIPLTGNLGSINPILGVGQTLALVTALVGTVLILLQKPTMGLAAGLMGIMSFVFAILYMVSFQPGEILNMAAGGASVNIEVVLSFGVYLTIIGGLLLAAGGFMQTMKLKKSAKAAAPA